MRPRAAAFVGVVVAVLGLGGCTSPAETALGETRAAVAHEGPWEIPPETLAIGDTQDVNYTEAGPWLGESGCYGSLTPGTSILRRYLLDHFPGISSIGGYSCDQGVYHPENMGIHGSGRAIDVMITLYDGDADNDVGDPIGNFLIENAQLIGVQYIIWDRVDWIGSHAAGDKAGSYSGTSNPHTNHLHVEMSVETSENAANWFEGSVIAPRFPSCPIPAEGTVIDDVDPCVIRFGAANYWRSETAGYGGGLHWTNAWDSSVPGNWAKWNLAFAEAGRYRAAIYLDPAFAMASGVRYEVAHGGIVDTVYVDQASGNGWHDLGSFDFVPGEAQSVAMFDNQEGVADNQRIALDALQLTRLDLPPPATPDAGAPEDARPEPPDAATERVDASPAEIDPAGGFGDGLVSSCSVGPGGAGGEPGLWLWSLAALVLLAGRRRRR